MGRIAGKDSSTLNIEALRGWVEYLRQHAGVLPGNGEATSTETLDALAVFLEEIHVAGKNCGSKMKI